MLWLSIWWATASAADPYAIRTQQLFDGEDFVGPATVVIEGETIVAVHLGNDSPPTDLPIVELGDATLTPGLIDAHQHFMSVPLPHVMNIEKYGWGKIAEEYMSSLASNREATLRAGVTSVVDLASQDNQGAGFRNRLQSRIRGPDWYTSGPAFTARGGHPQGTIFYGMHDLEEHAVVVVRGTAEHMQDEVDAVIDGGADIVKVVYDSGSSWSESLPVPDLDLLRVVVARAHERDRWVTAHVTTEEEALAVLQIGVDALEHAFVFSDDSPALALMVERQTLWTPTLSVFAGSLFPHEPLPVIQASVRRAHEAGVPIAAGTDFPSSGGWDMGADLHGELALLEGAGLDRGDVLAAATTRAAAKAHGQQIGQIAPGYRADLVAWQGDLESGELGVDRVQQVWQAGTALLQDGDIDPRFESQFRRMNFIPSPYAYYDDTAGVVFGANISHFDIANTGVAATLTVNWSLDNARLLSLFVAPPSPIPKVATTAVLAYDDMPKPWFGGGNDTRSSDKESYRDHWTFVSVDGDYGASRTLGVRTQLQNQVRFGVDDGAPGAGGTTAYTQLEVGPYHDTRDSQTEPWRGSRQELSLHTAVPGASAQLYYGGRLDLRGYVTPIPWYTLAARVVVRQVGPETPFFAQPEFGGAAFGRGYASDRFVDRLLVGGQLEVRGRVFAPFHAVLFADVGQVAPGWSELTTDGFHASVGSGLRWRFNANAVLAWDFGFGLDDPASDWTLVFRPAHTF